MEVTFSDVMQRMRSAGNLKNDSRVARAVNITPQAISNYKKRGALPTSIIIKFAKVYGLSVDWLLWGQGNMYLPGHEEDASMAAVALEGTHPYETEPGGNSTKRMSLNTLSPEEIICVGKLLLALRSANEDIKKIIETFLDSISRNSNLSQVPKQQH